jgi:hypothetical protein
MPLTLAKQKYTDSTLDRFVKTNMYYQRDPYIRFQDPTYLGFKLFFLFDQPDSGLLSTIDHPNTAYGYLIRIGEDVRAAYLKRFVEHLKNINLKTPWFFQTLSGLGEAWKHGFQEDKFSSLLKSDRKMKIGCLDESVDLRITALMDLYRKACFDWPNRREIVPLNLRRFSVSVYCYESREINRRGYPGSLSALDVQSLVGLPDINEEQQEANNFLLGRDPQGKRPIDSRSAIKGAVNEFGKEPVQGIKNALSRNDTIEGTDSPNPNISRVMFNFKFCEILPDESGTFFDEMTNKEMKLLAQNITFSYRDVYEENLFNTIFPEKILSDKVTLLVDGAALDNPNIAANPKFAEGYSLFDINNPIAGAIAPFASLAADKAERLASSFAGKLLLGNIYGFSAVGAAQSAQALLSGDPVQIAQVAQGILRGSFDNKSLNNDTKSTNPNTKFFDLVTPNNTSSIEGSNMGFSESSSNSNDQSSNSSTSQPTGNPFASRANDNGFDSSSQPIGNPQASLSNDQNSNSSSSQPIGNPQASLSNDNGFDSSSQPIGNPQASLSNDQNSNSSTSQPIGNPQASLSNDNGFDSSSQPTGNPQASLSNDNGFDSSSQSTGNPQASLSNG